jgi:hypothetical protein
VHGYFQAETSTVEIRTACYAAIHQSWCELAGGAAFIHQLLVQDRLASSFASQFGINFGVASLISIFIVLSRLRAFLLTTRAVHHHH